MATKTIKGASLSKQELTAYNVGVRRLQEIGAPLCDFTKRDVEYVGRCSIRRVKVIVGKVGKVWVIKGSEKYIALVDEATFMAHYSIQGKRSMNIYRDPGRDRSKPLSMMSAMEIFMAGKGAKPCRRKAPKAGLRTRIMYSEKMEKFPKLKASCTL